MRLLSAPTSDGLISGLASGTTVLAGLPEGPVTVQSTGITDSTALGRELVKASSQAAARTAIGSTPIGDSVFIASTKLAARQAIGADRGAVDLRDWDAIRAGTWQTSLGLVAPVGGDRTKIRNDVVPFTAADVGKMVIATEDGYYVGPTRYYSKWLTKITAVSGGVATVDNPLAVGQACSGQRVKWGFDSTDAINAALESVWADPSAPKDVYLPGGVYVASQIAVPQGVSLRGAGWGNYQGFDDLGFPSTAGTLIQQLPGSEKSLIVLSHTSVVGAGRWWGPGGISYLNLLGPDVMVRDNPATTGSGLAFRTVDGTAVNIQDGCDFRFIQAIRFPENGFDIPAALVPATLTVCRAFNSGKYGFDFSNCFYSQNIDLDHCTADANVLGGVRFKYGSPHSSITVTGFKSEQVSSDVYGVVTGYDKIESWSGVGSATHDHTQFSPIIFEDCFSTPVTINGLSHICNGGTYGPGPAILVTAPAYPAEKPQISFSGVGLRANGSPEGTLGDSVTLRDVVAGVDIPRTIASGQYPIPSSVVAVTTSVTLGTWGDQVILVGSGGAPILPTAVGNTATYRIKNAHTSAVTIATTSSQTIDGATTLTLNPNDSVTLVGDGANWKVF